MKKERTKIDNLVEPAVKRVAEREKSYFRKSEVVDEVTKNKNLANIFADLRGRYRAWKLDTIIMRYVEKRVADALQQRDSNGIRIYECYAAGERERRWLTVRAMTADTLRAVMQETRTQARQLTIKGEGYQILLEELEGLGDPNATVDDVYDVAVPKIRAYRAAA